MEPKDPRKSTLPEDGPDLEDDLQSIREQLSAVGDQEPPVLLDQAVLNTARRELAGRKRRPLRWIGGFATASVLVLTLTLVIQQQQATAPLEADRANDTRLDQTSERQSGLRKQEQTKQSADMDSAGMEARAREDAGQHSAMPAQAEAAKRKAEDEFELEHEPAAAPVPPPAAPRSEFSAELKDAVTSQPKPGEDAPVTTGSAYKAVVEGNERDLVAGQSQRRKEDSADDISEAEQTAELSERAVTAKTAQDELKSAVESPAEWVARMLELRENEQYEQLQRELDAFEAAYPEYPLPAELTGFAE